MTDTIRVSCLLDRSWDFQNKCYVGNQYSGTLIDISVQGNSDKVTPVGIVLLDNLTFQIVPMEFITKLEV